jgi:hypothetical protein
VVAVVGGTDGDGNVEVVVETEPAALVPLRVPASLTDRLFVGQP